MTPKPNGHTTALDLTLLQPLIERLVQALTTPKVEAGPKFVSVKEAAEALGLSLDTVKGLCRDKKLAAIRDKRQWKVLRSAIQEWKP